MFLKRLMDLNDSEGYAKSDKYVTLTFVAFAFGGLFLLEDISGNVVGWMDIGSGVFGAVLLALGAIGAYFLVRRK